jgi:hypothetical protein
MAKDPHAPPASEEEQFHEVARLLGVALHRWHRLNQTQVGRPAAPVVERPKVQPCCTSADEVVHSAASSYQA